MSFVSARYVDEMWIENWESQSCRTRCPLKVSVMSLCVVMSYFCDLVIEQVTFSSELTERPSAEEWGAVQRWTKEWPFGVVKSEKGGRWRAKGQTTQAAPLLPPQLIKLSTFRIPFPGNDNTNFCLIKLAHRCCMLREAFWTIWLCRNTVWILIVSPIHPSLTSTYTCICGDLNARWEGPMCFINGSFRV